LVDHPHSHSQRNANKIGASSARDRRNTVSWVYFIFASWSLLLRSGNAIGFAVDKHPKNCGIREIGVLKTPFFVAGSNGESAARFDIAPQLPDYIRGNSGCWVKPASRSEPVKLETHPPVVTVGLRNGGKHRHWLAVSPAAQDQGLVSRANTSPCIPYQSIQRRNPPTSGRGGGLETGGQRRGLQDAALLYPRRALFASPANVDRHPNIGCANVSEVTCLHGPPRRLGSRHRSS